MSISPVDVHTLSSMQFKQLLYAKNGHKKKTFSKPFLYTPSQVIIRHCNPAVSQVLAMLDCLPPSGLALQTDLDRNFCI